MVSYLSISDTIKILQKIDDLSTEEALNKFSNFVTLKPIDEVLDEVENMEKKYYLSQHPNKLYEEIHGNTTRWRTYIVDNGKRKPITAVTKSNLENKIVDFYKKAEKKSCNTLETLYPLFLAYKEKETSMANAHKINWAWERFYKNELITQRNLEEIKLPELKEFFLDKIEAFSLKSKQFKEMKSVLNMLYDYALNCEIVKYNLSRSIHDISYKKFTPANKKTASDQIFIDDEESSLINIALSQYKRTQNTAYLGICLNFTLALRVGELVALKLSDFSSSVVHIQRQEAKKYTHYKDGTLHRSGYEIVPHTKSIESDREIPLTNAANLIISMIKDANTQRGIQSDFLMLDRSGKRMNNDAINNVLRRLNRMINTSQKGNHSIRKTCISNMNASKLLSDEEIRGFAGHKDIATTQKCYIFATTSLDNRRMAYEDAISSKMPKVFKGVQVIS